MANVSLVVPDLEYRGQARQVSLLAPALRTAGHTVGVYALDATGPFADVLRSNQIGVEHSSARDMRNWLLLRWMVPRPGSGIVHAFGLNVLRRFYVATIGLPRPAVVLSLSGRERLAWFDRRCLRIVSRVIVPHSAAAGALIRQGVPSALVTIVPLAVGDAPAPPDRAEFLRTNHLPPDAKLVLAAGRMESLGAMFDAVCASEFLRYADPVVWLLVFGAGPDRERLENVSWALAPEGSRVRFLGATPDLPALLGLADAVLVPQQAGGANVALEAMAADRAVVVVNNPDLAAVVDDSRTGVAVPVHDPPAAARALRRLMLDPTLRTRLGDAARRHVRERHSIATAIRALEAVYAG